MTPGTEAVVSALAHAFRAISIEHGSDSDTGDVHLDFKAEGRDFRVWIDREFDRRYGSSNMEVDLAPLGEVLRSSGNGIVRVTRTGIESTDRADSLPA